MSTQIFKNKIPDEKFINLLDNICIKNEKYYTLNKEGFKRGLFNELIQTFLEECIPYYHISKRRYIEDKPTYNSFMTVLRQICKYNNFTYTSHIQYDRSSYCIVYFIFYKT